jgi:DNA-binding NarL/FixJ family response regulator
VKILLVEDHAIVREGIRRIVDDELEGVEWGEAGDAREAVAQLGAEAWDLVLLDLGLPGRSGLELVKELHQAHPDLPILVLTMYAEDQYALRCFRAGAVGYVTKQSAPADLVRAIGKVTSGGRYVSPTLAEHLATTLTSDTGQPLHASLSDRELQVLRMLASGMSVKEIAYELDLSDKTISTYRARILEKMNMRTAAQLMRYAIRAHLVD